MDAEAKREGGLGLQILSIDLIPSRVIDRFWANVKVGLPDECWEWTGKIIIDKKVGYGYGRLAWGSHYDGSYAYATSQRLAFVIQTGQEIPPGILVRHLCHNPKCCNAKHLALGDYDDNRRDNLDASMQYWGPRISPEFT